MSTHVPNVIDDVSRQIHTNYMGIASFVVLIWDHVDTFTEEARCMLSVEYIWKFEKRPSDYLFLLNRYLTPLGFIVNLFDIFTNDIRSAYLCRHFIRFEGSMTMIGIHVVGLMMLLRIYALYHQQRWIVAGVGLLLVVQAIINGWLLTQGERVSCLPSSISIPSIQYLLACTMIFSPSMSVAFDSAVLSSSSAWLPLLYDTVIVTLTVIRLLPSVRNQNASFVLRRLLEDGLLYYGVILAVNTSLTIMIIHAPDGLKNITAQCTNFTQWILTCLLQVAMMSRITLNLKKSARKGRAYDLGEPIHPSVGFRPPPSKPIFSSTYSSPFPMTPLRIPPPPPRPAVSSASSVESHLETDKVSDRGRTYVPPYDW
ncbi:hypothetical protein L208DRAFT_1528715 [Tricholoma matsutake]|nr:hypothetical protein L208DRAFT_1528715 [Tricholoma matsutake 945]